MSIESVLVKVENAEREKRSVFELLWSKIFNASRTVTAFFFILLHLRPDSHASTLSFSQVTELDAVSETGALSTTVATLDIPFFVISLMRRKVGTGAVATRIRLSFGGGLYV